MATVHVVLSRVTPRPTLPLSSSLPIPDSTPLSADTMASSGVSAQAAITAPDVNAVWSVTVTGGNVLIAFGANPTAVADAGWLILDGQTRDFAVVVAGEKVAIKDA